MAAKTRERTKVFGLDFGHTYFHPSGGVAVPGGFTPLYNGRQKTVSEGHPINRSTGQYDSGGPFFTSRVDYNFTTVNVVDAYASSPQGFIYSGPVYCKRPTDAMLDKVDASTEDIDTIKESYPADSLGATAIARCSPGDPRAQLGQALIESRRDGLPSLQGARTWRDRTLSLKNVGDEYLNHQYGWEPLRRDVTDSAKVVSRSGQSVEQMTPRDGTNTRREYEFPQQREESSHKENGYMADFPGYYSNFLYAGDYTPVITLTKSTVSKRWFVGNFTFKLPSTIPSWRKHEESGRKARELLGLQLTPELLWEVTPWSWAVDWFSNVGDVMSNVTKFQLAGLIMRYGYVMEETVTKYTITQDILTFRHAPPFTAQTEKLNYALGPVSTDIVITTKSRAAANPFGFGVGWEGLNPFQLSIAAALGISRLR